MFTLNGAIFAIFLYQSKQQKRMMRLVFYHYVTAAGQLNGATLKILISLYSSN
jgi:hypothetical protein